MKSWETSLSLRVAVMVRPPAVMMMGVPEVVLAGAEASGLADDVASAPAPLAAGLEVGLSALVGSPSVADEHAARVNAAVAATRMPRRLMGLACFMSMSPGWWQVRVGRG